MQIKKRKSTYMHNSDAESVKDAQAYKKENPEAELVEDDEVNHKATGLSAITTKNFSKSLGNVGTLTRADTGKLIGANTMRVDTGKLEGARVGSLTDMSVTAKLRSAKKVKEEAQAPKKLQGEVSLGPTESIEMKPEREGYMSRLKKRMK